LITVNSCGTYSIVSYIFIYIGSCLVFPGYEIYDNCDNNDITADLIFNGAMAGQTMDCMADTDTATGTPIGK